MRPQAFASEHMPPLALPCRATGRKSKDSKFAIVTLLYYFKLKPNKRTNLESHALKDLLYTIQ